MTDTPPGKGNVGRERRATASSAISSLEEKRPTPSHRLTPAERRDLAAALDPCRVMVAAGLGPDPWQAAFLRSNAPRRLLCCSRQSGKSSTVAALAAHVLLFEPRSLTVIVSPSLRQSGETFRKVQRCIRAWDPGIRPDSETALSVALPTGSRCVCLPGSVDNLVGFSAPRLVIFDEAAYIPPDPYYAVRPMLAASPGGRLVALSTPNGKQGWFYDEWAGVAGDWERTKITAAECPRIKREFLEEERRSLGDRAYRQFFEAEFLEAADDPRNARVFASASLQSALDRVFA